MSFLLRIYFLGLVAFVPDQSGGEMTVLLLSTEHGYHTATEEYVPRHYPMLVARAGSCQGDCQLDSSEVAARIFGGQAQRPDPVENQRRLSTALGGGGAWMLDQVSVSFGLNGLDSAAQPSTFEVRHNPELFFPVAGQGVPLVPRTPEEAEDFGWVVNLGSLDPDWTTADPEALASPPTSELVAAKIRITQGTVKAFRLTGFPDEIVSIQMRTLPGQEPWPGSFPRAAADVVVVEIPVGPSGVTVGLQAFASQQGQRFTLSPELSPLGGLVEVAILNLPEKISTPGVPDPEDDGVTEIVDHHFEQFYELLANRPLQSRRPVPVFAPSSENPPGRSLRSWLERPQATSPLLDSLGLLSARYEFDIPRCLVVQITRP